MSLTLVYVLSEVIWEGTIQIVSEIIVFPVSSVPTEMAQ